MDYLIRFSVIFVIGFAWGVIIFYIIYERICEKCKRKLLSEKNG